MEQSADSMAELPIWIQAIAAGIGAQLIVPLFRIMFGSRIAQKKIKLEALKQHQDEIDSAYIRLERENVRLRAQMDELEEENKQQREHIIELRGRCEACERFVRMMGRRGDLQQFLERDGHENDKP